MDGETREPTTQDPALPPGDDMLLKSLVALGGEVFVLRAEMEALRRLRLNGEDLAAALDNIRRSADYQAWLAQEGERFARSLLAPLADGRGSAT